MLKKLLLILFLLVVVAGAAGAGVVWWALQPVNPVATEKVRFTVPKGQAVSIMGQRLTEAGLLKHPLVFRAVVQQAGLAGKLQAGSFELSASQTPQEIAQTLTQGTEDIWITIPEGWRREEIAEYLAEQDLAEFNKEEFLELTSGQEGQLFPETYLVPRAATAELLANLLTRTFEQKVLDGLADELAASPHSAEEIIIIASLLEREATGLEQMKHVAGILENRLELGMPLQMDATLQYVKGYDQAKKSWWAPPLAADKTLDSPFNTYQNPGLPPRPIANPGLDAIKAALDPMEVDDLFYIHDLQGNMHYAETLDEHNANVQKYLR